MTFIVKCDTCGKTQEVEIDNNSWPANPKNPQTGEKWYSRYESTTQKTEHACCREHCDKKNLIWPV